MIVKCYGGWLNVNNPTILIYTLITLNKNSTSNITHSHIFMIFTSFNFTFVNNKINNSHQIKQPINTIMKNFAIIIFILGIIFMFISLIITNIYLLGISEIMILFSGTYLFILNINKPLNR